jgi:Ca2+-binding RTX toxin-like protein
MDIYKTGESAGSNAFTGKKSRLQKGTMAGTTILTSLVLSACGSVATNKGVFTEVAGTFTGTNLNDILSQSGSTANLVVNGLGGADSITTGSGNDLVRAGGGSDTVNTGLGDDTIVMVGTTTAAEYSANDIPAELLDVLTEPTLNGQSVSEAVSGGSVDGGGGTEDTLHLFGTMDMSTITLTGIERYVLHSNITFGVDQLTNSVTITGGSDNTTLNIKSSNVIQEIILSDLNLTGINKLSVGENVIIKADNFEELTSIGIKALVGAGIVDLASNTGLTQSLILDNDIVLTYGAADITDDVALAMVDLVGGNILPEYVGRSSAYLDPIASTGVVTFLVDLSTIQVDTTSSASEIAGYFVDIDRDGLDFTLSGTDSDKLSIETQESDGSMWLVLNANEVLDAGSSLNIDITATDSLGGSVTQTLSFWTVIEGEGDSTAQTINGTAGADILLGATIDASSGTDADILNGLDGNDHLNGGYGNDTLNGGNGDDLLKGRFGDDVLTGGLGADTLSYTLFQPGDGGKFITTDGNDTMLDFEIGTDIIQFEVYQRLGNEANTLSEFKAGFGTMWNAQISQDTHQIKLVFEDALDGSDATVTLVLDDSNLQTIGDEGYQDFADVDAFLVAIGTDTQLDFV